MLTFPLPLFPLDIVACPGGLVPLKIFEPRYLEMVRACVANQSLFAIVTVLPEGETDPEGYFPFANIGTAMEIVDADSSKFDLMMIRCVGKYRIKVNNYEQQYDGLFVSQVTVLPNDLPVEIPEDLQFSSEILKNLIDAWQEQKVPENIMPFVLPYHYEDAAWVSNRWVEILNLPLLEKQRLMQLESPIVRLELIQDILEQGYQKIFKKNG